MERFWETTPLEEMSDEQWESLCDGCGRCCLQKLQDIDSNAVFFTRISCKQLNLETCRCKDYANRKTLVPDCTLVRPLTDEKRQWLPDSCAYRRLSEGRGLANWHPLVSGSPETVHQYGISVRQIAVSEVGIPIESYEKFLIDL